MAGVDTVRMLFATQASAVGRFRKDTTLFTTMGELRREVAAVRALASSSDGTVGRFRGDSAIFIGLDSAFKELTALFTDLRKHPLRYIVF
jgi:hypothetical protein